MVGQLVTVRSYNLLADAELARTMLESAGIESFLSDANIVRMDWFYANVVGGIKLQVREADAESAQQILEQAEKPEAEDPRTCPQCNSSRVRFRARERRVQWLALMVFSVPLPLGKRFECEDCGYAW